MNNKKLKALEEKLLKIAARIISSKTGYIRLNRHTVSMSKKGELLVYDDELKVGKHRFGKLLNKKQKINFFMEAVNDN